MDPKWISELAAAARNVALTFLAIAAIVIAWVEREAIGESFANLTSRMQTAEFSGVKVSFGQRAFAQNDDLKHISVEAKRAVRGVLTDLSAPEVERLLHRAGYPQQYLSEKDLHCDYEHATSRMRIFAAADEGLAEKKLVRRIDRPDLTKRLREDANAPKDIGEPSHCYQMVLTPLGSDLKSVLVSEVARVFGVTSFAAAPTPEAATESRTREARSSKEKE